MLTHVKNYLQANAINFGDVVLCEVCGSNQNTDIHHLIHRQKNRPELDKAYNLIALCRVHHTQAHGDREFNRKLLHDRQLKIMQELEIENYADDEIVSYLKELDR